MRTRTARTVALLAVLACTDIGLAAKPKADGGTVAQGMTAWSIGNAARAVAIWRPLAANGDADAQYHLGQAYRLGRGTSVDEKAARDWYGKAAKRGHPQAQANYGLLLFQNGDRKGAMPWLEKASSAGDPRAQYVFGTALFNGDVIQRDWTRAYAMMSRASAAGLPPAVASLKEMDKTISPAQRQQATALARDLERTALAARAPTPIPVAATAAPPPATSAAVGKPAATPGVATAAARPAETRDAGKITSPPPRAVTPAAPAVAAVAVASAPAASASMAPAMMPAAPPRTVMGQTITPPPATGAGGWRVQVGAYSDSAAAGRAWDGISGKVPGLVLQSHLVPAGAVTRLQAGPLSSRADATRACARIKAASGTDCFPVAAP